MPSRINTQRLPMARSGLAHVATGFAYALPRRGRIEALCSIFGPRVVVR